MDVNKGVNFVEENAIKIIKLELFKVIYMNARLQAINFQDLEAVFMLMMIKL